jgi:subtilisin family serine protease
MRFTPAVAVALAASAFAGASAGADPARELIVCLAPAGSAATARVQSAQLGERLAAAGLVRRRGLADGLAPAPPTGRATAAAAPLTPPGRVTRNPFLADFDRIWLVEAADSLTAAAALERFAADPDVAWIEPNQRRAIADAAGTGPFPDTLPNDPKFGQQWALYNPGPAGPYHGALRADVHAREAWRITTGSNDLKLAIADTGLDPHHPEFEAMMPGGYPRVADGLNVTVEPGDAWADSNAHGTQVTGVIAMRTNDGAHWDTLGMAGVCGGNGSDNLGCRIVPIKIAPGSSGEATSFDIARAIVHATNVGARAMNLSFAGDAPSRAERSALYYAITRGCVVVAASGNRGTSAPRQAQYPAAYAADGLCIMVGGSDWNDRRVNFSSYGPGLDLVAPGVGIWTTYLTYPSARGVSYNGYVANSGTSFAAPHVAGAVGLLASVRPELTDTDFQRILRESADDIEAAGWDEPTAHGRLNAARALEAVGPAYGVWHDEVAGVVGRTLQTDTLVVGESGPGTMDRFREWHGATLLEITATVAIPDSFLPPVRVWPRVGGTMTLRGDFRIPWFSPWAEVIGQDDQSFTLRGYIYRAAPDCQSCGDDGYLPLPPDQARFGFTVLGPVNRGLPRPRGGPNAAVALSVSPNPFAAGARIAAPGAGRVEIVDVSGRIVRRATLAGERPAFAWDGRDERGAEVRPGVYLVRFEGASGRVVRRVVKLAAGR